MASLLITGGRLEGEYFRLPEEPIVTVGRDDQCTLQLLDRSVSRQHLRIQLDAGTGVRTASDYRSANGVAINGALITCETALADGDEIRLGETTMIYQVEDHPDAKTALAAARRRSEWKRSTLMRPE